MIDAERKDLIDEARQIVCAGENISYPSQVSARYVRSVMKKLLEEYERSASDESTYDLLKQIVAETKCKPGWTFDIYRGEGALRLVITVPGVDSWDERTRRTVSHWFPVPPATYGRRAWQRWIFECCRGVENHELGEWFRVGDRRPFLPLHGPGEMPYAVVEYRDSADALTTQDGSVRDEGPRP